MKKFIKLLKLSDEALEKQNKGEILYPSDLDYLPCDILADGTIKEIQIKEVL